jgi:hypothetical protein
MKSPQGNQDCQRQCGSLPPGGEPAAHSGGCGGGEEAGQGCQERSDDQSHSPEHREAKPP